MSYARGWSSILGSIDQEALGASDLLFSKPGLHCGIIAVRVIETKCDDCVLETDGVEKNGWMDGWMGGWVDDDDDVEMDRWGVGGVNKGACD